MTDSIPQARVVRKGGLSVAQPPPPRDDSEPSGARLFLAYAVGMWPLTGVVALLLGLLYMAAMNGRP